MFSKNKNILYVVLILISAGLFFLNTTDDQSIEITMIKEDLQTPKPVVTESTPEKPVFSSNEYKYEIWKNRPTSVTEGFEPVKKAILNWSEAITPNTYYQVQVSDKEDFSNLEIEENLYMNTASVDIPAGTHYARVRSYTKTQTSIWSESVKLSVRSATPMSLTSTDHKKEIRLDWDNNENSFEYLNKRNIATVYSQDVELPKRDLKKIYQSDKTISIAKAKIEKPFVKRKKGISAKTNIGISIFSASYIAPSFSGGVSFSGVSFNATSLGLGYNWNKSYLGATYTLAPIKIEPEAGITSDKDSFNLQTIGIEGVYSLGKTNQKFQYAIQYGAIKEASPFFIPGNTTDISISENSIYYGKLGIVTTYQSSNKLDYVFSVAYAQPFSSSLSGTSSFDLQPTYSLLGSLGMDYSISPNATLELLYSIQKTSFDYTYTTASLGTVSGSRESEESKLLFGFKYLFPNK